MFYFKRDLDPLLAKRLAQGSVNPITLLEMKDINPKYTPRPSKRAVSLLIVVI